jgi:hypothetical protein
MPLLELAVRREKERLLVPAARRESVPLLELAAHRERMPLLELAPRREPAVPVPRRVAIANHRCTMSTFGAQAPGPRLRQIPPCAQAAPATLAVASGRRAHLPQASVPVPIGLVTSFLVVNLKADRHHARRNVARGRLGQAARHHLARKAS